jgi:endonuclease/exonuclease/phosphatase family metal-dependent hydrolase
MKGIRYAWLFLAIAAVAAAGCARGDAPCSAARGELRLMTINVWSGLDYRGTLSMGEYEPAPVREKRFRALVAEIRRLSPDVIAINEANRLPDYVERLAGDTGYDFIWHVGVSGVRVWRAGLPWNLKEGDALLARKDLCLSGAGREQLSGGGFVWNNLSFHTQDATQVLLGKIRVNGGDVYVAVTHWHASPPDDARSRELLARLKKAGGYPDDAHDEARAMLKSDCTWRQDEAERMLAFLDEKVPAGKKLIVLGDFNATADTPELRRLLKAGYIDTFAAASRDPGYTWDAERNTNIRKYYIDGAAKQFDSLYDYFNSENDARSARIDFILANRAFSRDSVIASSLCCNVLFDGAHPSDHFGVVTVVRVK